MPNQMGEPHQAASRQATMAPSTRQKRPARNPYSLCDTTRAWRISSHDLLRRRCQSWSLYRGSSLSGIAGAAAILICLMLIPDPARFISEINHQSLPSGPLVGVAKVAATAASGQFSAPVYMPSSSLFSPTSPKRADSDGNAGGQSLAGRHSSNDMSQQTTPIELPILGSVGAGEMELRIESETHKYFQIQDKKLRLTRPLDRDAVLKENSTQIAQQPISSIYLQVSCLDKTSPNHRKVIIPVLVKVLDHNDNAPKFTHPTYAVQVSELTPVDTILIDTIQAIDLDSANNGLVEYSLASPHWPASNAIAPRSVPRASASSASADLMVAPIASTASLSTTTPGLPGSSTSQASPTSHPSQTFDKTTSSATVVRLASAPASLAPSSSAPTINLDGEPIMNGPMEENDEDESDEALLAALGNSTDSSPDSDSPDQPLLLMGSPIRKRRKRDHATPTTLKRRIFAATTIMPAMTTGNLMPVTTTTTRPAAKPAEPARVQLWTNLMASSPGGSQDDLLALNATNYIADSQQRDSSEYFSLEFAPNTNRPLIKLRKPLDYESQRVHTLTILATDRASDPRQRLTGSALVVIKVLDGDDQGPAFILDQTGCATVRTLHQPTTSEPFAPSTASTTGSSSSLSSSYVASSMMSSSSSSYSGSSHGFFVKKRSVSFENPAPATQTPVIENQHAMRPLHRGFRVTDENFDFSDTLVAGEEDQEGEELPTVLVPDHLQPPQRHELATGSGTGDQGQVSPRGRRFPTPRTSGPPPFGNQMKSTTRARYIDYTCLTPNNDGIGAAGQAEYYSTVMSGETDYLLRIAPQAIKARDRDELNAPIRYSFINGTPSNYQAYFQINPLDASIKQVAPLERGQAGEYTIWVQAQEQTVNKLSSVAKLTIDVIPTDKNPPVVVPNSYSGFVQENSPIGSSVYVQPAGEKGAAIQLRVSVLDSESASRSAQSLTRPPQQLQLYEFETTSDAFKVNRDGFLYVSKSPLDRDPPHQAVHIFQVTARQVGLASSRSISSPISINVTLLDLNDNAPVLANSSLTSVQLAAGSGERGARLVTKIGALDKDSEENARMFFAIKHVSNGGKERFRINEDTGDLEALGRFTSGEQFSLTVQVSDELGRASQGIVEVVVVPGPNTGGPQFVAPTEQSNFESGSLTATTGATSARSAIGGAAYSVEISEGIAPRTAVFQVRAVDPENDHISYSIVDGNVNNDFYINSKTGTIYTGQRLDREEVSAYSLLVQARDSGGLASVQRVYVSVADNNDENPVFSQSQYTFSVDEGVSGGTLLGRVQASDRDSGENGQLSYQLAAADSAKISDTNEGRPIFAIDEQTGDIRLLEPLDYEQSRSHALIVTARDHGENPRSSTASVLVRVRDVQDESPYFERFFYEIRLAENSAPGGQQRIAQVQARDPDSVAQISYTMAAGNASLFTVDPQTGLVSTIRGLDFEEARRHTIFIGTLEASQAELSAPLEQATSAIAKAIASGDSLERSPICRIDISVSDINDNAPEFVQQPLPVRIQDSSPLGAIVARVQARDLDASEPNNQLRYEMLVAASSEESEQQDDQSPAPTTRSPCAQLFMIDASSGTVSVKSDLKRDSQSECNLLLRARDLGSPSLSSPPTSLTVFIDHIAEISPASMIAFADSSFTVELAENVPANTLVKILPVVNKPKNINFPLSCEILSGNELAKFYVSENDQRDCELRTRDQVIDYETKQRYSLTLKLNTIGSGSNARTVAHVNVNIIDRNDNRPIFQQPARYSHLTQNRFLAAIAADSPTETQVIQLRASDLDSAPSNGLVSYEILNDSELEARFKVDPIDGIVRTSRPVEDIPSTRLPLRLKIMARDHPESSPDDALDSIAEVFVNLIDDRHRLALVLKDTPTGRALDSKEELLGAIQERTGFIPGLEKAESLKIPRNGTLESDVSGTDFWFYLIEPGTFRIVSSDEPRVKATLLEARSQSSLLDIVGQSLGFAKVKVRQPYSISMGSSGRPGSILASRSLVSYDNLASTLIMTALFIAIISAIVVMYQWGAWSTEASSRSSKEKLFLAQQQQQQQQNRYQQQYGFALGGGTQGIKSGTPALTGTSQDFANLRSAFSTLQGPLGQPNITSNKSALDSTYRMSSSQAAFNKEYETQMLKMSVLFDDNHSVDEQNLNDNNNLMISKNLNGL